MTVAHRITEKLKAGPATLSELALEGVSASTVERTVLRMAQRGDIRPVGTRRTGKRGPQPYVYAAVR